MSAYILRTCIQEVVRCVASNHGESATVIFARGFNFAIAVTISREGDLLKSAIATAAGIGPVDTASGSAKDLEAKLIAELSPLFENAGAPVSAEISANSTDFFIPVGRITCEDPNFRCMDGNVLNFLSAAVERTLHALTTGESHSSALRVEAPGKQWPTWILVDLLEQGGFTASTNDVDLMTGCPPTFHCSQPSADLLKRDIVRFLSGEFLDALSVDILIRVDRTNLVGRSVDGPGSIREQEVFDLPV